MPTFLGPQVGSIAKEDVRSWGSPQKGTKSQVVTSPMPSQGPKNGRTCYITLAFLGVPQKGDKNIILPPYLGTRQGSQGLCSNSADFYAPAKADVM